MEAKSLPIYNTEGKEIDTFKLDQHIFDGTVNPAVVHQAVVAYLACQRRGLASTKTMGEVSGGGRKPWRQKGTGRARVGSIRSPLWRHGGVVFGPHPRGYSYVLPAKIRKAALKSGLNAKINENTLIILDDFKIENPKTREAVKILSSLKINRKGKKTQNKSREKVLLLIQKFDTSLKLALRNISYLTTNLAKDTHAYEVISAKKIVVTREALRELTDRLKK
ncbi:MAG: 50S ribosomal protein L4 [Candidatus Omnitrophica bacterium]|nr:50S ribosomal protein L4 [Candidatus Omnitrophota bacterium]MDD5553304.1 50S ribosomal protein L4 [Candidatus Omnitrophota bacterium]